MDIISVKHKGLKRLIDDDFSAGLPANMLSKIKNILFFLSEMDDIAELKAFPLWKPHQLTGNREGVWSISVNKNYRLTFKVKNETLVELDFEDYH